MDTLNDYYPLYLQNPDVIDLSDSELDELDQHRESVFRHQAGRLNKKDLTFDDWSCIYSDEIWYLWCMIGEYTCTNALPFFNKMEYSNFCSMLYDTSSKY
jgi:hypothetical protein